MVEVKVSIFNLIDFKCSSSENALIEKKKLFQRNTKITYFQRHNQKQICSIVTSHLL